MIVGRYVVGLLGAAVVLIALFSALKTVVVPRAYPSLLTRIHFILLRRLFNVFAGPKRSFAARDRVLSMYGPMALVLLPGIWVLLVLFGFTLINWGTGIDPFHEAFIVSGSSLLTLGFDRPPGTGRIVLSFLEAGIGLGLVSLMISYLPTIYSAFSRRESAVGMLEVRAGLPPSPTALLTRVARIGWLDKLPESLFQPWETWFTEIEESHSSHSALVFFRSPHPQRSWITAAGCVLDTASIVSSTVDQPNDPQAAITLRAGYLALRRIADLFDIAYDPNPAPSDPISVTRDEFDQLCYDLQVVGIPLKKDLDQAWRDFVGWRVNYDRVLVALCGLVVAPPAKWSSDRVTGPPQIPRINRRTPRKLPTV